MKFVKPPDTLIIRWPHVLLLMLSACLFAGCFTVSTVKKARLDRKQEFADTVYALCKDPEGIMRLYFGGQHEKYRLTVPFDSIISHYQQAKSIEYTSNRFGGNFLGVYYLEDVNGEKGFQRLMLFKNAEVVTAVPEQGCLATEQAVAVKRIKEHIRVPVKLLDSTVKTDIYAVDTKPAAFMVDPAGAGYQKKYIIAIMPDKKKYSRYLLTPLTAGLDIVTLPFQLIMFGTVAMVAGVIKF
jgi:hypothetical protein